MRKTYSIIVRLEYNSLIEIAQLLRSNKVILKEIKHFSLQVRSQEWVLGFWSLNI